MNFCIKFCGSPSNSCQEISFKTKNVYLMEVNLEFHVLSLPVWIYAVDNLVKAIKQTNVYTFYILLSVRSPWFKNTFIVFQVILQELWPVQSLELLQWLLLSQQSYSTPENRKGAVQYLHSMYY